ncbi:hypothetical protein JCM3766R1_006205 [Sporobolomyces carnicolor]
MIALFVRSLALTTLAGAALCRAAVTPTTPGGGKDVYVAGQECYFEWSIDETGEWKQFDVDLFTGHNLRMTNMTRVAAGLDGTNAAKTKYSFRCPEVDPPAPIYFYQFSLDGEEPAWTERFAIAAPNGTLVDAPNKQQLDGSTIPWGIGTLVNASASPTDAIESIQSPQNAIWGIVGEESGDNLNMTLSSTDASSPTATAPPGWPTQSTSLNEADASLSQAAHNITGFQEAQQCSSSSQCPEETPCCSEYGFCGTGRNCLSGCNPFASFEPRACAPLPACVDRKYSFAQGSSERTLKNSSTWNGDATSLDWLVESTGSNASESLSPNLGGDEAGFSLSLSPDSAYGTTITSTRALWYGNVTARIRTTPTASTVTGFSLVDGAQGEINFEMKNGTSLSVEATLYSSDDSIDLPEGNNSAINSTTLSDFHEYTVSWLPESITWLVDGTVIQSVSKTSSLDGAQAYRYPEMPARIRFWMRGAESFSMSSPPSGAAGESVAIEEATVSDVTVRCYPTTLIANFTFDNTTRTAQGNLSLPVNGTTLANSSLPISLADSSDAASILPFGSSPGLSNESQDHVAHIATPEPGEASGASSTVWWTPPVATPSAPDAPAVVNSPQAWLAPVSHRLRRRIPLERREDPSLAAYSYGDIDEDGHVAVTGWSGPTTIASDRATGLNSESSNAFAFALIFCAESGRHSLVLAAGSSESQQGVQPLTPSTDDNNENADQDKEPKGDSRLKKWQDLPTWARALIIGGSVAVALLLVVIIVRCWRRASGSTATPKQKYVPIGQAGPEFTPDGLTMSGAYDPAPTSAPINQPPLKRSSTASSASSRFTTGVMYRARH